MSVAPTSHPAPAPPPPASPASPLAAAPAPSEAPARAVTLADLAGLDEQLVASLTVLDDLLYAAEDATSAEPVMTGEAQHADVLRHGVALRALLQLSRSRVDGIRALLRLAEDQRRARIRGAVPAPAPSSPRRKEGAR